MSLTKKKIIACQILTDELPAVLPKAYRDIDITWLDAGLHMDLDKLEITLKQALKDAVTEGANAKVLFGNGCHPDMCHIINNQGGKNLGAKHCVEAFCHERGERLQYNGKYIDIKTAA